MLSFGHFFPIYEAVKVVDEKNDETDKAVEVYGDYIAKQVLANNITVAENMPENATDIDFDGFILKIAITKC